jgi:hypothetical protein
MSRTITRTVGDLTDPEFRRERAAKAARAAHHIDVLVRRVAARADELTPQHAAILRPLLPAVESGADARGDQ